MKPALSVVALARNEEKNMAQCLDRFAGWADQIFIVVDDRTNDATVAVAQKYDVEITVRKFGDFVAQRNWGLRNLPFRNEWVLFIDPDEYPTEELKKEIETIVTNNRQPTTNNINGYYIKRRFIFWGKWLKHGGYYPVWILRLMRHRVARCEGVKMDEHFAVEGATGRLANDLVHDDRRGLRDWLQKHRWYAEYKAEEYLAGRSAEGPTGGDAASRKRAANRELWDKLPLFVRPFLYWGYVMFVRGGFLDGIPGIVFHTLRGFWYPLLIDVNICRARCAARKNKNT